MPILNFPSIIPSQTGNAPRIIQLKCNDSLATVTTIDYLYPTIVQGFSFLPTDIFFIAYGENSDTFGIFTQYIQPGTVTLQLYQPAPNLYLVNTVGTIYISLNGGINWMQTATPPDDTQVIGIFDQGKVLYTASVSGNIGISTNNGATWSSTPAKPGFSEALCIWVTPNGIMYVGTEQGNVYISNNGGVTWTATPASPSAGLIFDIFVRNNGIYILCNPESDVYYVYFSTNGGATWTTYSTNPPDGSSVGSIYVTRNGYIYGTTVNGNVALSYDDGFSWVLLPPPGNINSSYGIAVTYNNVIYTAGPPGSLVFSNNNGETWNITSPFLTSGGQIIESVTTNAN